MPICPNCKNESAKRKSGRCPKCLITIDVSDGVWYLGGTGAPSSKVITIFEELVSKKLSGHREPDNQVTFRLNRKSGRFLRELSIANKLVDMANNDLDLIHEALAILFHRKLYTTLLYIEHDFNVGIAIALANREANKKKQAQQDVTIKNLTIKQNLFK